MIGATGDFEMESFVTDEKPQRDVISDFGTQYGAEDGWSDEMQGIGNYSHRGFGRKTYKRSRNFGEAQMGELAHPMAGFEGQMGDWLSDLKASAAAGLDKVKAQITTQANTALDKAKADITTQANAQKDKLIADAQKTITTQATQLIAKATDTASAKLNQGIVAAAQSPAVQNAVTSGTNTAIDKIVAYKDELVKKSKPVLIAGGIAGGLLLAWYIMKKRRG